MREQGACGRTSVMNPFWKPLLAWGPGRGSIRPTSQRADNAHYVNSDSAGADARTSRQSPEIRSGLRFVRSIAPALGLCGVVRAGSMGRRGGCRGRCRSRTLEARDATRNLLAVSSIASTGGLTWTAYQLLPRLQVPSRGFAGEDRPARTGLLSQVQWGSMAAVGALAGLGRASQLR